MKLPEADAVLGVLNVIDYPALMDPADPWYSYKFMSLLGAVTEVRLPGDYAQFGVYRGRCARFLLPLMRGNRRLHLFDSFQGLPEDWLGPWKKGEFALEESEIPTFDADVVTVHQGWFKDTVAEFARTHSGPLALLHLDADLYSSTLEVLELADPLIETGTVLLFDEYAKRYRDEYDDGEHRALHRWAETRHRKFDFLWRTPSIQAAVRITG